MKRGSGILMPISSLPSQYGIGGLGASAYEFVDFLKLSKQHYWQILPLGPTGYGDSPYQSFSAYAFNPYFVDLDMLCEQKLLTAEELKKETLTAQSSPIDYNSLYKTRGNILKKAVRRFNLKDKDYVAFTKQNAFWLDDYALFMAIKQQNGDGSFTGWDKPLRTYDKQVVAETKKKLGTKLNYFKVVQYMFFSQYMALKKYANDNGIEIIGDIPIYVSPDSSDLWANPELFQVGKNGQLTGVAGCPPDAFSSTGQLWGNPLYDWDYHSATGFEWWMRRIKYALTIYDTVRIDHFRGFEGYYSIPAGAKTAKNGRWRMGPGIHFINTLKATMPEAKIIAEDLGFLTLGVYEMLRHSGFPGMKVLQFAFDSRDESDYLPHNYPRNSIVYTGTHDNTTTNDWQKSAPKADVEFCRRYLNLQKGEDVTRPMVRAAMASVSDVCIVPLQDWLGLGKQARINTPSTLGDNWQWRVNGDMLTKKLSKEIADITELFGRANVD